MKQAIVGCVCAVVAASLLAQPAVAQTLRQVVVPEGIALPAITTNCSGGVVYDDGTLNAGYAIGDGDPGDATMLMRFDLPVGTTDLDQVCLCFSRNASEPSTMSFDVVIRNNNGSGGSPGTLIASLPFVASGIPIFPSVSFFNANLTSAGLVLPDNTVYVGAEWPGRQIFMCGDTSTTTTQRTSFGSGNQGSSWSNLTSLFPTGPPRAMGIRVDPATTTGGACTPSSTAICLNNNRFRLAATFQAAGQPEGTAQAVKMTDDTGYLWFFNNNNVEAVVKVLTACGVNNRYWVFAGGLTDVRTVITVTDTQNGAVKTYVNPQGSPFQPIQDTSAFATCP